MTHCHWHKGELLTPEPQYRRKQLSGINTSLCLSSLSSKFSFFLSSFPSLPFWSTSLEGFSSASLFPDPSPSFLSPVEASTFDPPTTYIITKKDKSYFLLEATKPHSNKKSYYQGSLAMFNLHLSSDNSTSFSTLDRI